MLRTTQAVVDAAERIPDLAPVTEQAFATLKSGQWSAEQLGAEAGRVGPAVAKLASELYNQADILGRRLDMTIDATQPLIVDAREAVSAWKTAGHAVTVAAVVIAVGFTVGLIVFSTWKPEEFR